MTTAKIFLCRYHYIGLIVYAIFLSACVSTNGPVRMYEGDKRPDSEIAKILVPYELDVLAVDGKSLKTPYVPGGQYEIEVLPGDHEFRVFYEEYWGDPTAGGLKVSDVFNFKLSTIAGSRYVFKHNGPEDLVGADSGMQDSDINIWVELQETGQTYKAVDRAAYGGLFNRAIRQVVTGSVEGQAGSDMLPAQQAVATTAIPPATAAALAKQDAAPALPTEQSTPPQDALEQLKFWWKMADEEQRKVFQAWTWTSKANSK